MNHLSTSSVFSSFLSLHPHLWCLCRTEHELTLPCIHFAQSKTAGFSVLLQLLLLPLLHIPVWC